MLVSDIRQVIDTVNVVPKMLLWQIIDWSQGLSDKARLGCIAHSSARRCVFEEMFVGPCKLHGHK